MTLDINSTPTSPSVKPISLPASPTPSRRGSVSNLQGASSAGVAPKDRLESPVLSRASTFGAASNASTVNLPIGNAATTKGFLATLGTYAKAAGNLAATAGVVALLAVHAVSSMAGALVGAVIGAVVGLIPGVKFTDSLVFSAALIGGLFGVLPYIAAEKLSKVGGAIRLPTMTELMTD